MRVPSTSNTFMPLFVIQTFGVSKSINVFERNLLSSAQDCVYLINTVYCEILLQLIQLDYS